MTIEWYQTKSKRSWHALRVGWVALCGKELAITAEVHTELPAGKSCENCLRILERAGEKHG